MIDLATELMQIVPHLREQHQYYSASVCYRAAEFLREYCEGHDARPTNTNADRIRSMTDEEMAAFLCDISECDRRCPAKIGDCIFSDSTCRGAWLDWLKQEAE